MSASITISRDSGWADRLRAYKVKLDHSQIGTIDNGGSRTFSVEPGSHELVLKIDWCGSNTVTFDVPENGSVHFECGSNLRGFALLASFFYVLFAPNDYLWLKLSSQ